MKTIELLNKLKTKPIVRVQDIARIAYCDKEYAKLIINRLKKAKLLKKLRRNAYTTKDDILVIASNITFPSYISFWYASYRLGYTEQIVNTIHIATTRKIKPIDFEGYRLKFIPLKHFFGYKKIKTIEGDIFIVEGEKLLIDAFLKPKECGNLDEIEKIFENSKISKEKLVEYLHKLDNQTIIKKVGFTLEKLKGVDISKTFKIDDNYVILDPFLKKWNKINKKWRIKYDNQRRIDELC